MTNGRIPMSYPKFDTYINVTNNFLQSNDPLNPGHKQYERLGLTLSESDNWKDQAVLWNTDLYLKYKNKDTKTISVIHACMDF